MKRFLPTLSLGVLALVFGLALPPEVNAQPGDKDVDIPDAAVPTRYVETIDGDTIVVELANRNGNLREVTVRLIGIDTPETNYAYGNEPECYGKEATDKTDSLLVTAKDDTVWLEQDVTDKDSYGRLLRYVWYESAIDGEVHLLNADLVREGYALAKTYRPNTTRQGELDDAEDAAIRGGRGMWLSCDGSVGLDPTLEADGQPDDAPIDRTRTPVEEDEEAACSFFDTYDEAQDFLDEYPEIAEDLDPDGNGVARELYFGV